MLAWDIAWLCRTQGAHYTFETWEDVCALGKNLWQLLVADSRRREQRKDSSKESQNSEKANDAPFLLGQFSHGTAHSFLGGAEGTQYMRDWKLKGPAELFVKVRAHLLAEMQGAEWEFVVQQDELSAEEPEIIGTRVMHASGNGTPSPRPAKAKGASGWTKLKSRNGETKKADESADE